MTDQPGPGSTPTAGRYVVEVTVRTSNYSREPACPLALAKIYPNAPVLQPDNVGGWHQNQR